MNPRLLVILGVVVVLGIGVLIWTQMGGDGSDVARDGVEYHCCFDDTVVTVANEDLLAMRNAGDAVLGTGPGAPPTRVKCTECGQLSCFKLDPATGQEIRIDDNWDLESTDGNARNTDQFQ